MRKSLKAAALAFVLGASAFALGGSSKSVVHANELPSTVELAQMIADNHHVSLERGVQRLRENDLVGDMTFAEMANPEFGLVWVDNDAMDLHVRLASDGFEPKVRELEALAGHPVLRTYGGAPASVIYGFPEALHRSGRDGDVGFKIDYEAGYVQVWKGLDVVRTLVDPQWIVEIQEPRVEGVTLSSTKQAGADVWYDDPNISGTNYNAAACTIGFVFKDGSNNFGYETAGHCPNWDANISNGDGYSASATPWASTCNQYGDFDVNYFQSNSPTPSSYWYDPYTNTNGTDDVAGGAYYGQISYKVGLTNDQYRTNQATIVGFASWTQSATSFCAGGTYTALWQDNDAKPGDSGGPVLVIYNGAWYLAGTTTVGMSAVGGDPVTNPSAYFSTSISMWVPWVGLPSGSQICTTTHTC